MDAVIVFQSNEFIMRFLILLFILFAEQVHGSLNIITTIKPIHSIICNITRDTDSKVDFIVHDNDSHHHYMFKPSDVKKISNSDIIFYISKNEEAFFFKFSNAVELLAMVDVLPQRKDRTVVDMHIWMSISNAKKIGKYIADYCAKSDSDNSEIYMSNYFSFVDKLELLKQEILLLLKPFQDDVFNYLVDHDSYQYFENEFSISEPYITGEIISSAKSLSSFNVKECSCRMTTSAISNDTMGIKTVFSDGLGIGIEPGEDMYFNMMRRVAKSFVECFR